MHPFVQPTVRFINVTVAILIAALLIQGLGFIRVFGAQPFWSDFLNISAIAIVIELINYARRVIKSE